MRSRKVAQSNVDTYRGRSRVDDEEGGRESRASIVFDSIIFAVNADDGAGGRADDGAGGAAGGFLRGRESFSLFHAISDG